MRLCVDAWDGVRYIRVVHSIEPSIPHKSRFEIFRIRIRYKFEMYGHIPFKYIENVFGISCKPIMPFDHQKCMRFFFYFAFFMQQTLPWMTLLPHHFLKPYNAHTWVVVWILNKERDILLHFSLRFARFIREEIRLSNNKRKNFVHSSTIYNIKF